MIHMGDKSLKTFQDLKCWQACRDDLIASVDEGFISREDYQLGRDKISNALALVNGYIRYLSRRLTTNH